MKTKKYFHTPRGINNRKELRSHGQQSFSRKEVADMECNPLFTPADTPEFHQQILALHLIRTGLERFLSRYPDYKLNQNQTFYKYQKY